METRVTGWPNELYDKLFRYVLTDEDLVRQLLEADFKIVLICRKAFAISQNEGFLAQYDRGDVDEINCLVIMTREPPRYHPDIEVNQLMDRVRLVCSPTTRLVTGVDFGNGAQHIILDGSPLEVLENAIYTSLPRSSAIEMCSSSYQDIVSETPHNYKLTYAYMTRHGSGIRERIVCKHHQAPTCPSHHTICVVTFPEIATNDGQHLTCTLDA